jgi:hypothetical protein
MRCLLYVGVTGSDGASGLERFIEIPFVPFKGLEIGGVTNSHGNLFTAIVESVEWNANTGELAVHLENDVTTSGAETLAEMLADWGDGWTIKY